MDTDYAQNELPLAHDDVRLMVRLLGEIAALPHSFDEKRQQLIRGLARFVGADAWIWGISHHSESGSQPAYTCLVQNGFTDEQFRRAVEANEHPDMRSLCAPMLEEFATKRTHLTRHRQQIVADHDYKATEVAAVWQQAGVGPVILSFYPLSHGGASAIALYRRHDRENFSARESRIAHVILGEVPWLHSDIPEIASSQFRMAPRLRQVLNLLVQGHSRKEVAAHLDLSVHTVSDYCKNLYRLFKVHSQAELVRRFSHGDGADQAKGSN